MLLNVLKILLLMLGAALIIGGSLTGLCGVIASQGEIFLMGIVPAAIGLVLFIAVARTYKKRAQPDPAASVTDDADQGAP